MPKLELERSVVIDATPDEVFAVISDLGSWRPWSPWLVTEPQAQVDVDADGKRYSWSGKRTGAGEMRIVNEVAPRSVDLSLLFLKPFRSQAKVGFVLEPVGDGTRVRWTMDSRLPFFMFLFTRMMATMIGMDYDRGLGMLKDFVETGEVPSRIEETGRQTYPGCTYVGVATECAIDEMSDRMKRDFERLHEWQRRSEAEVRGAPFTIYQKWSMTRGRVKYTCGVPVAEVPSDLSGGFVTGSMPSMSTFVVTHIGPYRHLGNAWSTGMQMARGKEFRQSRSHPPFESYANDPDEVDESDLRVDVQFPLR